MNTEQTQAVKDFIAKTVLNVVMTPGRGLYTFYNQTQKVQKEFKSFDEYQNWAIDLINGKIDLIRSSEDPLDLSFDLFVEILPMFSSSKDDGGIRGELIGQFCALLFE